jgi:hypothetical protein
VSARRGFPTVGRRLLRMVAGSLCISADVAPSGYVRVTALDKDNNELAEDECRTMIAAARFSQGKGAERICAEFDAAAQQFTCNAQARFKRNGER